MAQLIADGVVPAALAGLRVVAVDLGTLGGRVRDASLVPALVADARRAGNVLLVLEDAHLFIKGRPLAGLVAALGRGEIRAVATAADADFIAGPRLTRRFRPIAIRPPNAADALELLKSSRDRHEAFHRVAIGDAALAAAAELAGDYFSAQPLPDTALELIDETAARVRLESMVRPSDLRDIDAQIEQLNQQKEDAVTEADFEKAAAIRDQGDKLKKKKDTITKEWRDRVRESDGTVDAAAVRRVVADRTGIAFVRADPETAERLLRLEADLSSTVFGQSAAVAAVARTLRCRFAGLAGATRPIGRFLFAGPPGTGKSLLAAQLARAVYGTEDALIRIDLSAYATADRVARLIDGPSGDGALTGRVRRRPHGVVLLDHLDRAHPSAADLLLPLLEDGRLTDGAGRAVEFRTAVVIMTVTDEIELESAFQGFSKQRDLDMDRQKLTHKLEQSFRPAFLARLDAVVPFRRLTPADRGAILEREIATLVRRLAARDLTLTVAPEVADFLLERSASAESGAYAVIRAVEERLAAPLADAVLHGEFAGGAVIVRVRAGGEPELEFVAE